MKLNVKIDTGKVTKQIQKMQKNSKSAKAEFLGDVARATKSILESKTPSKTGRARRAIIAVVDSEEAFIGWTDDKIITYVATLNFGSTNNPSGWLIRAKGRAAGGSDMLIFPVDQDGYGPYNLPKININGKEFYIAKRVKHPYQEPMMFIEGTVDEIERLIKNMLIKNYIKALTK